MELSIKDLKEIIGTNGKRESSSNETFLEIGENYLIRTVTMIYSGKIKDIKGNEIILEQAAWIADTGRFADNLKSCEFSEVEPYVNDVIIFKTSFLDVTKISTLPLVQK